MKPNKGVILINYFFYIQFSEFVSTSPGMSLTFSNILTHTRTHTFEASEDTERAQWFNGT